MFDASMFLPYNDPKVTGKFIKSEEPVKGFGGVPMGWPGPWELIVILLIVVMLFGAKRIPEIMGGVGKGIKTFKKAMDGEDVSPTSSEEGSEGTSKEAKAEPKKSETTKS
jgi:sec-independent protein translocase protein TatA